MYESGGHAKNLVRIAFFKLGPKIYGIITERILLVKKFLFIFL